MSTLTPAARRALLDGVVGIVEANTYEQHMLWNENRHRAQPKTWKENPSGLLEVIGHFCDMPVCVSLITAEVGGHKLAFVHAISQVVDYRMIDSWMNVAFPESAFRENGSINKVDAMNFHNVFLHAAAGRTALHDAEAGDGK